MGGAILAAFVVLPRKAEAAPIEKVLAALKDTKFWMATTTTRANGGKWGPYNATVYKGGKIWFQSEYFGGAKRYHHTAPITAFYALHEGLTVVMDEGLENRFARHRKNRKAFVAGIEAMGMEMHVAQGHRLWNLMTPKVPAGISDMAIRKHMMDNHGIEIAGGLGELAGKAFRIGLMGVLATEKDTLFLLEKFEEALRAHGFVPKASAVTAAKAAYAAS